jgi:hypothetical protein
LVFPLAACATAPVPSRPAGPAKVNPATIAATPAAYDGHDVQVVGLLVWEFERLGLYQSYGAYCREGEKSAIAVEWETWPGVKRTDNRRLVMIRGIFRNRYEVAQPNGEIIISNGAPGPGPLEPGAVVRWLSPPKKPCPRALP